MNNETKRVWTKPGTPEHHIKLLKSLRDWLKNNPKNLKIVEEEVIALDWALQVASDAGFTV